MVVQLKIYYQFLLLEEKNVKMKLYESKQNLPALQQRKFVLIYLNRLNKEKDSFDCFPYKKEEEKILKTTIPTDNDLK